MCCYFLFNSQNEVPEVKLSALKALKISTKILTKSQRLNYYCILSTIIQLDVSDSIRYETLSCVKEAAKFYKEEIDTEIIQKNISVINGKHFYNFNYNS